MAVVSCGDVADVPSSIRLLRWRQRHHLVLFLSCQLPLPILCRVSEMSRPPDSRVVYPLSPGASPKLEALHTDSVSWSCQNKGPQTGWTKLVTLVART